MIRKTPSYHPSELTGEPLLRRLQTRKNGKKNKQTENQPLAYLLGMAVKT